MREKTKSKNFKNIIIALIMIFVMVFAVVVCPTETYAGIWKQNSTGWWYDYGDGTYPASKFEKIDGQWYYFNSGGYMLTGWQLINSKYYYFNSSGHMLTGWQTIDGQKYYLGGVDDGAMRTGWQLINSKYYYFNSSGHMLTGWQTIDGQRYYLGGTDDGVMRTGWQKIDGKHYYFNGSGHMLTGWQKIEGKHYYLNSSGQMLTGWQTIDGQRYYLGGTDDGVMRTGWQELNGKWYYFGGADDGAMKTNTWADDCYLGSDGVMLTNQWVDDYYVGSNGKMVTNAWAPGEKGYYYCQSNGVYRSAAGWFQAADGYWYYTNSEGVRQENAWCEDCYAGPGGKMLTNTWVGDCYVGSDGVYLRNTWLTLDGKQYYLGGDGYCYKNGEKKIGENWYYFDANGVKKTGFFDEDGCFYDENGVRVRNDWVEWGGHRYYIGNDWVYLTGFQKIEGKWYYLGTGGQMETGRVTLDGVTYFFDDSGAMLTGWHQDSSTGYWYYLNPTEGSSEGAAVTGKHTIDGTAYFFDSDGVLIDDSTRHYHLNPYYEYTDKPGGLYGTEDEPFTEAYRDANMKATMVHSGNVNEDIPVDYIGLVIGAKAADKVTVNIDSSVLSTSPEGTGWEKKEGSDLDFTWEWTESVSAAGVPQVANVTKESDRSKVASVAGGNMYAIYENIGVVDGKKVNLKVSVVDYALLTDGGDGSYISFPTIYGKPGILVLNIAWIQLKYEIMDQNNNLIASTSENPLKGTTSYYDVDHRQVICFNGDTNRGVYTRNGAGASNQCQLMSGTVKNFGSLNGICVFDDSEFEYPETAEYRYRQGFTETFEGNTLVRTFSFQHGTNQGNGGIYHDGEVVESGDLEISKTVFSTSQPAKGSGPIFTFDITLFSKDASDNEISSGYDATLESETTTDNGAAVKGNIDFESGKATVQLKHGQKIKILGLPSGLSYRVTEADNGAYVTMSSKDKDTIQKDKTATASFENREKVNLTVNKTVTGQSNTPDKDFVFNVLLKYPDGKTETVSFCLKNGSKEVESTTYGKDLPYGTKFTVTENDYSSAGYTTKVDGVSGRTTGEQTLSNDKTVNFANNAEQVTLKLEKQVKGLLADKNKTFTFDVLFYYGDEENVLLEEEITLKDGESKSYTMPFNTSYKIVEALGVEEGYETVITGADETNALTAGGKLDDFTKSEDILFTNKKDLVIPTGVDTEYLPYLMMVVGAIAILSLYQTASRRRKMDDRS